MSESNEQKNHVLENLLGILRKYGKITNKTYSLQFPPGSFNEILYNGILELNNKRDYFRMCDELDKKLGINSKNFEHMYKLYLLPIPNDTGMNSKENKISVQLFGKS